MNKKSIILLMIFVCFWDKSNIYSGNPNLITSVMKKNNQPLFYIERSKNKNRVYYDANFNSDGTLNSERPIDVYWVNLEENYGKRGELSYIQEKWAYGYNFEKITDKFYQIKLKAFDKRIISLMLDNKGKAKAQIKINGRPSILNRLFIKANDRGLSTSVEYIELFGTDICNNTETYEKFEP